MLNLIIVDDEERIRESIKRFIPWDEIGIGIVSTAKNGIEALEVAHKTPPHILLTDIRMPKMNGIELASRVRELYPSCKIIFLTGYADKEYLKSAIKLQAIDYIEKPVNRDEIKKTISDAVSRVLKEMPSETLDSPEPMLTEKENNKYIIDVMNFIKTNYFDQNLSIRVVAKHVCLSQTYLCALFKKSTEKTINEFITEIRMEKAKELLKNCGMKLYEVADSIGIPDSNYFSTVFKKYTGMPPIQYRERI